MDSGNPAVQDSIALLFERETGLIYEPEEIEENVEETSFIGEETEVLEEEETGTELIDELDVI